MQSVNKKLKSRRGFTLVELVVVIAVLAILAGVGSVAYSGYITKANDAADLSLLAAIKTAADSAAAADSSHFVVDKIDVEVQEDKGSITKIIIYDSTSAKITVTVSGGTISDEDENEFKTFLGSNTLTFKGTYEKGAQWTTANNWQAKDLPTT